MTDDAYGGIAERYDTWFAFIDAPLRRRAFELHPVGEGTTVLDVGCGTGTQLAMYADAGATCFGLDMSPSMLAVAERRLGDRAELTHGSGADMPYEDASFDLVVGSLFLHELEADLAGSILREMARVVHPTGTVLIIDYRSGSLRWKGTAWRAFSMVTERLAGSDHYGAWRSYLADGGLASWLPDELTVTQEKIVAGGNLSIWLLARASDGD